MLTFQKSKTVMPHRTFFWSFWMQFRYKICKNGIARTFTKYQLAQQQKCQRLIFKQITKMWMSYCLVGVHMLQYSCDWYYSTACNLQLLEKVWIRSNSEECPVWWIYWDIYLRIYWKIRGPLAPGFHLRTEW